MKLLGIEPQTKGAFPDNQTVTHLAIWIFSNLKQNWALKIKTQFWRVFMLNIEYWSLQRIVSSGRYPFTIGQMRHFLLYRHRNGLQDAVWKIGKRLVFRLDLFNAWIDSKGLPNGSFLKEKKDL